MKNTIIIVLALIILTLTNPSKSQYTAWANGNIVNRSEGIIGLLSDARTSLTTISEDYYIATVFTTFRDGEKIKVLGIAGSFIDFRDLKKEVLW